LIIVIAIIIIAAALIAVGYPLLLQRPRVSYATSGDSDEGGDLRLRKETIYAAIKELDFDFRTGKLSPDDYHELREKYRERAMALLLEMEKGGRFSTLEGSLEEEIRARRESTAHISKEAPAAEGRGAAGAIFCPYCGEGCSSGDKFCPYCGRELPPSDR
jgi:hypothetical protein